METSKEALYGSDIVRVFSDGTAVRRDGSQIDIVSDTSRPPGRRQAFPGVVAMGAVVDVDMNAGVMEVRVEGGEQ